MAFAVEITETVHKLIQEMNVPGSLEVRLYIAIRDTLSVCSNDSWDGLSLAPVPFVTKKIHVEDSTSGFDGEFLLWINRDKKPHTRTVIHIARKDDLPG